MGGGRGNGGADGGGRGSGGGGSGCWPVRGLEAEGLAGG